MHNKRPWIWGLLLLASSVLWITSIIFTASYSSRKNMEQEWFISITRQKIYSLYINYLSYGADYFCSEAFVNEMDNSNFIYTYQFPYAEADILNENEYEWSLSHIYLIGYPDYLSESLERQTQQETEINAMTEYRTPLYAIPYPTISATVSETEEALALEDEEFTILPGSDSIEYVEEYVDEASFGYITGAVKNPLVHRDIYFYLHYASWIVFLCRVYFLPVLVLLSALLLLHSLRNRLFLCRYAIHLLGPMAAALLICSWMELSAEICAVCTLSSGLLASFLSFLAANRQLRLVLYGARQIVGGETAASISPAGLSGTPKQLADTINHIGEGLNHALAEQMKSERLKTELITNVSHDLKTPLTLILSSVDLLKQEPPSSQRAAEYIEMLDRHTRRLNKMVLDLIEASKASTGNLPIEWEVCGLTVLLEQMTGEYQERFQTEGLSLIWDCPSEPVEILADGKYLWRIFDNLMGNILKYAQPQTRVYLSLEKKERKAILTFRNVSRYPLNISAEELTERFVRGDRSRNTEGSGLGLSIAQNLTRLMHGEFSLSIDGDLFKVVLAFPINEPDTL